jgi:hypothetical protein
MGKAGLEWLFRLYTEPRRLMGRYLLGNPWFPGQDGLLWRRTPSETSQMKARAGLGTGLGGENAAIRTEPTGNTVVPWWTAADLGCLREGTSAL